MRKRLILIILLVLVVIIGTFIFLVNEMKKISGEFSETRNELLYYTLSNEYADIFDSTFINKSANFITNGSKRTNPLSTFIYDNKFAILIYKLNITTKKSAFLRDIKEEKTSTDPSNGIVYRVCELSYWDIQYRQVFSKDIQEMIVCFEKDTKVNYLKKTDSLAYYHIPDGKFSLRFGKDSVVNLCSDFRNTPFFKTTTPPLHLLLLKKHQYYYLLLATAKDKSQNLPADFLIKSIIK